MLSFPFPSRVLAVHQVPHAPRTRMHNSTEWQYVCLKTASVSEFFHAIFFRRIGRLVTAAINNVSSLTGQNCKFLTLLRMTCSPSVDVPRKSPLDMTAFPPLSSNVLTFLHHYSATSYASHLISNIFRFTGNYSLSSLS